MTLTEQVAHLVVAGNPMDDPKVLRATRAGLLDWLSAALAGRNDPGISRLTQLVVPSETGAKVIAGGRTSATDAALINGTMGHALDYDDVHVSSRGHPSAVVLPALLALAETRRSSPQRFLSAYAVGVEAMCRLALALGPRHYERGWHSTATLGAPAAAIACAYLCEFDPPRVAQALGLALTQSAGLRAHFGTQVKALHAGLAARAGLVAAQWAEVGLEGSPTALDGETGFLAVYGDETTRPSLLTQGWGAPWQIADPGLWFKRYPCCSAAYHAAEAALELRSQGDLLPEEIERVAVTFPPGGDAALSIRRPKNRVEGRFSAEYVVALALAGRELSLESFGAGVIESEVERLMHRVERRYDESIEPSPEAAPPGRFTVVSVETRSGRRFSRRVDRPRGAPGAALTLTEQMEKFRDATVGLGSRVTEIPTVISVLEELPDIQRLTALL